MKTAGFDKAAERGVPSLVWREGQNRRLSMIQAAAGYRLNGKILVDGCGIGSYLIALTNENNLPVGIDIELERVTEAKQESNHVACAAGENLPFPQNTYDLVLSHEVIEHVQGDRAAVAEVVRVLRPGGRMVLFCPNRGYPFETHGIYLNKKYHFGNVPGINYLPRFLRDRFAPHVRVYSTKDLERLFEDLPIKMISKTVIFGAYDNIIARMPKLGKVLRFTLHMLEKTPLRRFGLSHFWVIEKTSN